MPYARHWTQHCAAAKVRHGQALAYGTKRWPALCRFLDDGHLDIDNNIAERALRGVAVGRRNWLFAGSKTGGERAAAIYTVIQTCKANGVDPQAYIADVTGKIAADWPAARWDELMPWSWAQQPAKRWRMPHSPRPAGHAYPQAMAEQGAIALQTAPLPLYFWRIELPAVKIVAPTNPKSSA
jgi:hypothetical protein